MTQVEEGKKKKNQKLLEDSLQIRVGSWVPERQYFATHFKVATKH